MRNQWESVDTVTHQPRRVLWCQTYRKAATAGNETNNFAEATVHVFKDVVLRRFKAYNPVALIVCIGSWMEEYYSDRLVEFIKKPGQHFLLERLEKKSAYLQNQTQITVTENVFQVPSSKGDKSYDVDVDLASCTCPVGYSGGICKHQYGVSKLFNISLINELKVTDNDMYQLAVIGLGENAPPPSKYSILATEFNESKCQNEEPITDERSAAQEKPMEWFDINVIAEKKKIASSLFNSILDMLPNDDQNAHTTLDKIISAMKSSNTTPNQAHSFLCAAASKGRFSHNNSGKRIRVQPTALSRRREGVNRGSRPVTQGRPSVLKGFASHSGIGRLPKCVKQKGQIKRLHNLSLNIELNQPNQKPHGSGH